MLEREYQTKFAKASSLGSCGDIGSIGSGTSAVPHQMAKQSDRHLQGGAGRIDWDYLETKRLFNSPAVHLLKGADTDLMPRRAGRGRHGTAVPGFGGINSGVERVVGYVRNARMD